MTTCEWFARCANEAAGVAPHPILGAVPICVRCAKRFDLNVTPFATPPHLDVTADNGVPFRVVFLPDGVSQSRPAANKYLTSAEPMVEFYDHRHIKGFTPDGQFVSSYYASTLLGRDESDPLGGTGGIDLYGGERSWSVDADTMVKVRAWVTGLIGQ